jgi:hypothetical protein
MQSSLTPPPPPPSGKAPVFHLVPPIKNPLNATSSEIVSKLKKALVTAQSGAYAGSILFTVDKDGYWKSDISGRMYDNELPSVFRLPTGGFYAAIFS